MNSLCKHQGSGLKDTTATLVTSQETEKGVVLLHVVCFNCCCCLESPGALAITVLLELCTTGYNNDKKAVFRGGGGLAGFKCLGEPSSIFQRSEMCWKLEGLGLSLGPPPKDAGWIEGHSKPSW